MVRIKKAGGTWEELTAPATQPKPFTRTNGTRMTDDEIAKVAQVDVKFGKQPVKPPKHTAEEYWNAVQRLGSQTAAAKEMGVTQAGVQSGLKTYMKAHGIEGPLPGLATRNVPINGAARFEPLEEMAARDNADVLDARETIADDDSNAPVVADVAVAIPHSAPRRTDAQLQHDAAAHDQGIDLTYQQAQLVLGAVNAPFVIDRLRDAGFDVVIRLRREVAA